VRNLQQGRFVNVIARAAGEVFARAARMGLQGRFRIWEICAQARISAGKRGEKPCR